MINLTKTKSHFAKASKLLAAASILGVAGAAHAADDGSSYDTYVYFGGFYLDADNKRIPGGSSGDSYGVQAGVGKRLSDRLWVEGLYFGSTIETGGAGTDFYQNGFGVDLQYAFGQRSEFTPYLLAGLGGVYNDVVGSSNDKFTPYLNVGAGFTRAIFGNEQLRLRGELRAVYDDYQFQGQDGMIDYRAMVGLEMGLGAPREVIREVEKVVIKEVPVERVVVQEVAAPVVLDSDGDGVPDDRDLCPNTPAGARVDANGCVIEQTLVMRDITFEFNSARLTTNAQRLMENVVAFLRADPQARIIISGHTDSIGSEAYNLKLSRDRANEVRDYLIGYGIDAGRLTALGFGKARPIASNDTEIGRETNRRVEFRIEK
jgi:OOP family OmpA-OmpF porin